MPLTGPGAALAPTASPLVKTGEFRLKYARQGAAAAVHGDKVYIFGGNAGGAITYVERFTVGTAQVEPMGGNLLPRRYHSVLEHGGKFYLFGGEGYGLPGNPIEHAVEIYDPVTQTISQGAAMPKPRSNMAAVKYGTKGYFMGGSKLKGSSRAQTNDTDIFDFTTGEWSVGVPMPTPREAKAELVGDFILIPGGYSARRALSNVEMFIPVENAWKNLPPLHRAISAHSLVFHGEHLFLFGHYDDPDSVVAYNLRNRQSTKISPGYKGARHSTAVVCGGKIYVIGGNRSTESGDESDLIQVFADNPAYVTK